MKKLIYFILIVGVASVIFLYRIYSDAVHYALNPDGEARIAVNVSQGMTASDVADLLYEKSLIKSPAAFRFYLSQHQLGEQIKAGRIVVKENMALPDIVQALVEGRSEEVAVTIPEGWTIRQIAERLEDLELTTREEFLDCIKNCEFDFKWLPDDYREGYLYPDTYFVDFENFSVKGFISRMMQNFENRIPDEDWDTMMTRSSVSFSDTIIMASIVEREERDPGERPTVAGILWKRYNAGMGLGADATVLYALGRTKGGLSYENLQIDSPYNTRKYRGLPPTPICNPSVSSIQAALYPEKTDYWYYLHDSEGAVHYAKTLEEHNENKRLYIQ